MYIVPNPERVNERTYDATKLNFTWEAINIKPKSIQI